MRELIKDLQLVLGRKVIQERRKEAWSIQTHDFQNWQA